MAFRTRMDYAAPVTTKLGAHITCNAGVWGQSIPVVYTAVPYRRLCVDEVHPRHPYQGGPFNLRESSILYIDGNGKWGSSYTTPLGYFATGYRGKVRCNVQATSTLPPSNEAYASSLGPTCWNKYKPAKPVVSGGVFLAELREMGPHELFRQLLYFRTLYRTLRNAGMRKNGTKFLPTYGKVSSTLSKMYLAYQFGWSPFLSDLRKWLDSLSETDKKIAQLRQQNGKWQRKGGTLFENSTITTSGAGTSMYPSPTQYTGQSRGDQTSTVEKCWFVGKFRYYIPGLDDRKWGKFNAHRDLWGLEISPEVVWQLLPYSWLVDWYTDVGKTISNFSSMVTDQLVSKYAYVMYTKTYTKEYWTKYQTYILDDKGIRTYYLAEARAIVKQVSKTRVAASPFGFNLGLGDLTPFRLSILSALGLSKLRFGS